MKVSGRTCAICGKRDGIPLAELVLRAYGYGGKGGYAHLRCWVRVRKTKKPIADEAKA